MPEPEELERRTTELLQRLIQFDTVNPPGNEEQAQTWLKGVLENAGFTCELLAAVEGRPNLVASLRGASDGPTLALLSHVDTVLADRDDWSVDPWSGDLKDGCVWGRGALDMKSQLAAEVAAATLLAEQGWRPEAGELKIVVTADEEAGATHGAKWLCEQHPDKVRCDLALNEGGGDPFDFDGNRFHAVCVAEKGVFRFTLSTHGRAGHASIPRIGDNALTKLAPIIEAMGRTHASFRLTEEAAGFLSGLGLGSSEEEVEDSLRRIEEVDPRVAVIVEPMLGVTLAPTMVRASQKINVIPAKAELMVDCRVPPGLGEEAARAAIEDVVGADGYRLEFAETVIGNRSAVESPLMETVRGFLAGEVPDATAVPTVLPGFTDSRWFREAFPDCVAYGFFPRRKMDLFEAAPLIHGADERIPVEDLGMASRFFAHAMEDLLR